MLCCSDIPHLIPGTYNMAFIQHLLHILVDYYVMYLQFVMLLRVSYTHCIRLRHAREV
jgi:hypothetical protein